MKRLIVFLSVILVLALAACGGNSNTEEDTQQEAENNEGPETEEEVTIKIGASSVPHAEILEEAQPILAEQGINIEIEPYEDYILPNDDLANGELDANYFQHIPYLEQTVADTGYELTHIGGIHIEPMGVYSKTFTDIDSIPDGTEVILSNSVSDHGRVLGLFQSQGLITLDEDVEIDAATIDDIVENPKDLQFTPDYDPAFLPELYETEEDTLVVINTNYAIEAGLTPLEDSLFIEGDDSPYVNVIAVRTEDENNASLQTVVDVLHSEEIQDFILENYEGAVVPVK